MRRSDPRNEDHMGLAPNHHLPLAAVHAHTIARHNPGSDADLALAAYCQPGGSASAGALSSSPHEPPAMWEGPELEAGKHTIAFDFKPDGPGLGKGGVGVLSVDGKEVARNTLDHTTRSRSRRTNPSMSIGYSHRGSSSNRSSTRKRSPSARHPLPTSRESKD